MIVYGIIAGLLGGLVVLLLALLVPGKNCPNCAEKLPRFRKPASKEQAKWGGQTCPQRWFAGGCGSAVVHAAGDRPGGLVNPARQKTPASGGAAVMKWFPRLLVFTLGLLLMTACSEIFYPPPPALTPTPAPRLIQAAPTGGAPTAPPLQVWDGRTVRRLCLEVQEIYGDKPAESGRKLLEAVFQAAGIEIAAGEAACEARLRVNVWGALDYASYTNIGACYNGHEISGEMELSAPGEKAVTYPIRHVYRNFPEQISDYECNKNSDPASLAVTTREQIVLGLKRYWGGGIGGAIEVVSQGETTEWLYQATEPEDFLKFDDELLSILVEELKTGDAERQGKALQILVQMGMGVEQVPEALPIAWDLLQQPQPPERQVLLLKVIAGYNFGAWEYVPYIIRDFASSQNPAVAAAAFATLGAATNKDLGSDPAAWQKKYPLPHPVAARAQMAPYFWGLGILIALEALWGCWLMVTGLPGLYGYRLPSKWVRWLGLIYFLPCLLLYPSYIFGWEFPLWYGFIAVGIPLGMEVLIRVILRPNPRIKIGWTGEGRGMNI